MRVYCPLVSKGSYCIVEDTKLSRWSTDGPLESVHRFMGSDAGRMFKIDRWVAG